MRIRVVLAFHTVWGWSDVVVPSSVRFFFPFFDFYLVCLDGTGFPQLSMFSANQCGKDVV